MSKKTLSYLLSFLVFLHGYGRILKKQIPDKLVVLSFDDAPKTHFTFVAPLLKKYHYTATFFVCEFPPDFADTSKYMTWKQIEQLGKMGFEIGNHTKTHTHVNKMNKQQYVNELSYIENKCDSLKIPKPNTFAYPGYDVSSASIDILREKGYVFARAGGNRLYDPLTDHPYLMPSYTTLATNKDEIMNAFAQAKDGKIVVLTIHGVPDYAHDWVTTPPAMFEEYLKYLHDNHYIVIGMNDLLKYINIEEALNTIKPDFTKKTK